MRILRVLVLTLVSALAVAAVSFVGDHAAAAPDPVALQGGRLIVASGEITNMDPYRSAGWFNRLFKEQVYEPLVRITYDGSLEPRMAESWKVSPDGKVITFALRRGVKFHNGKNMTAQDVKYSLDRARNPQTAALSASVLGVVDSVDVVDEYTVAVRLKNADAMLIRQLYNAGLIVPADPDIDHTKLPIGTGPFKFNKFTPGQSVLLKKFADYYIKGMPYLDEVEFRFIPDDAVKVAQLLTGQVDIITQFPLVNARDVQARPNLALRTSPWGPVQTIFYGLDRDAPVKDKRVRQAISYAIDRERIARIAFLGLAKPRSSVVPTYDKDFNPKTNVYKRDVAKAKQLLAEAGFAGGLELEAVWNNLGPESESTVTVMQSSLAESGIRLRLVGPEQAVFIQRFRGRQFVFIQSSQFSLPGGYPNIWMIVGRNMATLGLEKALPDTAQRILSVGAILDEKALKEAVQSLQVQLDDEQLVTLTVDAPLLTAMKADVRGYRNHPVGSIYIGDLWLNR